MKKRSDERQKACMNEVIFRQALMPLEAAIIPARERRFGTLSMVPRAYEMPLQRNNQRAKIWVR